MASRLLRVAGLAKAGARAWGSAPAAQPQAAALSVSQAWKSFTPRSAFSTAVVSKEDIEHAAGLERAELEVLATETDPWHEAWLDAPRGTEDNPVEVTSAFSERIVGVTDLDDDSLVWWGVIEEGQPPKQIIEGGEYFVLKRIEDPTGGHH